MIIQPSNYSTIDYSKYNRIFMFGCSFTNFFWPTWAHILCYERPQALAINFGIGGGGNFYIAERISAANQKYRFTEEDLILVMWTTFFREDRYIKDRWIVNGNLFNNNHDCAIEKAFYNKYGCPRGCLIRDCAIINLVKKFLQHSNFDSIMLSAIDIDFKSAGLDYIEDVKEVGRLYSDVFDDLPQSLFSYAIKEYTKSYSDMWSKDLFHNTTNTFGQIFKEIWKPNPSRPHAWPVGHIYYNDDVRMNMSEEERTNFEDYHPAPITYLNYLKSLNLIRSEKVIEKCIKQNDELLKLKKLSEIMKWYDDIVKSMKCYYPLPHLL